jgi:hypothetical protein
LPIAFVREKALDDAAEGCCRPTVSIFRKWFARFFMRAVLPADVRPFVEQTLWQQGLCAHGDDQTCCWLGRRSDAARRGTWAAGTKEASIAREITKRNGASHRFLVVRIGRNTGGKRLAAHLSRQLARPEVDCPEAEVTLC